MEGSENEQSNSMVSDNTSATTQDSTMKNDDKEDLEIRFNKVRGFAVKLKKKVNDLTEELKLCEAEKLKIISEKDEIQKKVLHISDNSKHLQTIQLEYDKLQDNYEQQKNENKKLIKHLETVVLENTSLKERNYEYKENINCLTAELDNRTKEIADLKLILKKNQILIKKLEDEKKTDLLIREEVEKNLDDMKNKLDSEIQAHKNTRNQLDLAKQECTSNNVLSLEVDNYEKSIEDLKSKLNEETSKCSSLEDTIEEQSQKISALESQLSEMRDSCLAKANQLTTFTEKNEGLKSDIYNLKQELVQMSNEKQSLMETMEAIKVNSDKLINESMTYAAEKKKILREMELLNENHNQQVEIFKAEVARLNELIRSANDELETLKNEYEGYKLRAQSVLRTKQNQEIVINGKSLSEVQTELNHLSLLSVQLQEKLNHNSDEMKLLRNKLTLAEEERDNARDSVKDFSKKLSLMSQDYSNLREQCRMQLTTIEQLRNELGQLEETLTRKYTEQIAAMEDQYKRDLDNLQLQMSNNAQVHMKHQSDNKIAESRSDSDQQTRNEIHLLEREDAEGSESIESYANGNINSENNFQSSLIPLDELLNASDDFSKLNTPILPAKVDRQELELSERRVKHLTTLLADAERDVAKLNQMNQMLKEDIRRQQRSVEREHHANNFEYLKNVVFKFITLKNCDERSRLIPVLNTILKLSPEETYQLNQVAGVTGRSWLTSLPIPGWSNND